MQKSLLSCQVCPDQKKKYIQVFCSITLPIVSGRAASLCGIALFLTHCLSLLPGFTHTQCQTHWEVLYLPFSYHTACSDMLEAILILRKPAMMCCALRLGIQGKQGSHCWCATESPVPLQWLVVWKCHTNGLVPHAYLDSKKEMLWLTQSYHGAHFMQS